MSKPFKEEPSEFVIKFKTILITLSVSFVIISSLVYWILN